MFYEPEEEETDGDMKSKRAALQSMSKHIGADAGQDEEKEDGGDAEGGDFEDVGEKYDPDEGAIPRMKLRKKNKKGGGGGMGGMMGGGGGGMDISSMMGSMGGGM